MPPEEESLWDKFLEKYEKEYQYFEYDVHVGKGTPPAPGTPPEYVKMIEATSQKRIDAVGYTDDAITIFEVRPHAGLPSLGALLGYRTLYIDTFKPAKPINLVVVSDIISPDDIKLFADNKIKIILV